MTSFKRKTAITSALLMASALLAMPVAAHAQDAGTQSVTPRPTGSEEISGIVPSTGQSPNLPAPGGILDNAVNITGVGQFAYRPSQASTGLSVCTASLINPRTVILAAHCVNTLPVRRQNIWHNSRRRLAECRPRLGFDVKRRACGVASADARWSVV
ncbi:MAG: hypothetical protein ACK44O_12985 [Novosphingobium sp.]|jgi:V8-like Glu-specific endopeptidase|uniref:hypothetical protein n=1 Tax=Novosphingobium sp. TaxID=1874826 RepID=UPI00391D2A54